MDHYTFLYRWRRILSGVRVLVILVKDGMEINTLGCYSLTTAEWRAFARRVLRMQNEQHIACERGEFSIEAKEADFHASL